MFSRKKSIPERIYAVLILGFSFGWKQNFTGQDKYIRKGTHTNPVFEFLGRIGKNYRMMRYGCSDMSNLGI